MSMNRMAVGDAQFGSRWKPSPPILCPREYGRTQDPFKGVLDELCHTHERYSLLRYPLSCDRCWRLHPARGNSGERSCEVNPTSLEGANGWYVLHLPCHECRS